MIKNLISLFLLIGLFALQISCGKTKSSVSGDVENILGLWEVKAIHNSDEAGYKETPQGMFKMIMEQGKFMNFMSTDKGAIITVDGSYDLNGNIYTEKIVNSFNSTLFFRFWKFLSNSCSSGYWHLPFSNTAV